MAGRLNFAARPLKIGVPFNFQNMSEDGRLWYGWALLEEACKNVELRRTWSAEPERAGGKLQYPSLRTASGDPTERRFGVSGPRHLPRLQIPGQRIFPCAAGRKYRGFSGSAGPGSAGYNDAPAGSRLRTIIGSCQTSFPGELITFDRGALNARISLSTFRGADVIRNLLVNHGGVDLSQGVSFGGQLGPRHGRSG